MNEEPIPPHLTPLPKKKRNRIANNRNFNNSMEYSMNVNKMSDQLIIRQVYNRKYSTQSSLLVYLLHNKLSNVC